MSIKLFRSDFKAVCISNQFMTQIKWFLFNHTIHLVFIIRLGQSLSKIPFIGRFLSFICEYIIRIIYSSDISLKAQIGKGFSITHGHDIVIGADVIIGVNCKIFNGVTLGNKDICLPSKGNQPTIGNNVVISTGAKILGPLIISDNVIVGANAVVVKSCEAHSTYVGVPAKKVVR